MSAVLSNWTEATRTSTQSKLAEKRKKFPTCTEFNTLELSEARGTPNPNYYQGGHQARNAFQWRFNHKLDVVPIGSKSGSMMFALLNPLTVSDLSTLEWKEELINDYINAIQLSFLAEELTSCTVWADSRNEDCSMSESSHGQLETLIKTLYSYVQLPQDWDGYGGFPASLQAVQDAKHFLEKLPEGIPLPSPMLAGSGTVGLYWDRGELYISLDFEGDKTYTYLIDYNNQYSSDSDIAVDQPIPEDLRGALEKV